MNQKQLNFTRLFLEENLKLYLSLLLLTLTYFICLSIFKVPIFIFIYPTIIFYVFFIVFSIISFIKSKRKYYELEQGLSINLENITDFITTTESKGVELSQFANIIIKLQDRLKCVRNESKIKNKQIEEDISIWIHQIKLPITAMKLNLEDVDSYLFRELKSELFQIELYIDMILNYFRLESTSTDYLFAPVDVGQVIKNEIKRFSTEFIKRKINLEFESEASSVITDEKWFAFIIDQILSNALKYTQRNGIIKIEINHNQIRIKDSGIGIIANDLPRVFDRGYTGYNGRTNKKASGLGLYLTKRVCDELNISIALNSEVSKGTEVILNFSNLNKQEQF